MEVKSKSGVQNIWVKPNGKFMIVHKIKGKPHYYGTYETLEEAIIAKERLIKQNWIKEPNPMRYIGKITNGKKMKYYIQRLSKGCEGYFGSFETLEEAQKERDLLEQFDWDWEAICESIDETIEGKIIMRNRVVGCDE